MFTGIVETVGIIKQVQRGGQIAALTIETTQAAAESNVGDSIAVNGVCLTMARVTEDSFTADISAETSRKTTLGELRPGDAVNLELPLRLSDRLGGHLVLGHVDEVGTVSGWRDEASMMSVTVSPTAMRYIVYKGSVCVDGVSLTVAELSDDSFEVALIPHTKLVTTLGKLRVGARVNVEVDLLGRYVERLIVSGLGESRTIDLAFLREHGYVS
ncbi:MAG: riboflavin synthase [Candidatus Poribacteria bacterium]|nr:riboflavin synthase [Candidatus Poribacteria bacterium]